MLAGGDRRSIGRANEVAALALAGTLDFGAVCAAMFDEDPVVRMRAADAVEKVSVERPAWPRPFKAEFLAGPAGFPAPGDALADFALADPALRPRVIGLLEEALRAGPPAARARSRRLLAQLQKPSG